MFSTQSIIFIYSQALFDLFVDVLSHNLQEVAYNAHVAQLE